MLSQGNIAEHLQTLLPTINLSASEQNYAALLVDRVPGVGRIDADQNQQPENTPDIGVDNSIADPEIPTPAPAASPTDIGSTAAPIDIYIEIVKSIIQSQENIIGPVAVLRAQLAPGLVVDWPSKTVSFTGNPSQVIDGLIGQYQALFGQISVQVCRDAAARYVSKIPQEHIPEKLR